MQRANKFSQCGAPDPPTGDGVSLQGAFYVSESYSGDISWVFSEVLFPVSQPRDGFTTCFTTWLAWSILGVLHPGLLGTWNAPSPELQSHGWKVGVQSAPQKGGPRFLPCLPQPHWLPRSGVIPPTTTRSRTGPRRCHQAAGQPVGTRSPTPGTHSRKRGRATVSPRTWARWNSE